jgi:hypothetical protein
LNFCIPFSGELFSLFKQQSYDKCKGFFNIQKAKICGVINKIQSICISKYIILREMLGVASNALTKNNEAC